jgi:signal transduction histidine kinase
MKDFVTLAFPANVESLTRAELINLIHVLTEQLDKLSCELSHEKQIHRCVRCGSTVTVIDEIVPDKVNKDL